MNDVVPRIATYPIMSPNGLDYAEPHVYEIEQTRNPEWTKDTIGVLHRVRGDNLVAELLMQGRAQFACTVVAPWCAYRRVEVAATAPEDVDGSIKLEQQIQIATEQFSHPVMFQPTVIASAEIEAFTGTASHGLDELWIGEEVGFPMASTIAVQSFWNAKTTMQSILRLKRISDGSLKRGSFEVKDVPEEGFYFLVEVEAGLFDSLRHPASFQHRDSIYTMALSQGLSILHREDRFSDRESWVDQQNLKLLFQMLKERNVPTWEDGDEFKPNQVAAAFHPHVLEKEQE